MLFLLKKNMISFDNLVIYLVLNLNDLGHAFIYCSLFDNQTSLFAINILSLNYLTFPQIIKSEMPFKSG